MQYLSKVVTETINAKNIIDGKEMLLAIIDVNFAAKEFRKQEY